MAFMKICIFALLAGKFPMRQGEKVLNCTRQLMKREQTKQIYLNIYCYAYFDIANNLHLFRASAEHSIRKSIAYF